MYGSLWTVGKGNTHNSYPLANNFRRIILKTSNNCRCQRYLKNLGAGIFHTYKGAWNRHNILKIELIASGFFSAKKFSSCQHFLPCCKHVHIICKTKLGDFEMMHLHITIVLYLNWTYLALTAKISLNKKNIRALFLFH